MKQKIEGRWVTRFTLIVTLVISVIANVTHAIRADSDVSLGLRVPGAAVWPVLSFLAIEIIVRVPWRSVATHYLARFFVLGPAIPAVIVSYEHQSSLLTMMGENALVSTIGPLAIDGLMIGCTLALLFTRSTIVDLAGGTVEPAIEPAPVKPIAEQIDEALASVEATSELAPAAPATPVAPNSLAAALVVLKDGGDVNAAAEFSGMSKPAVRKYAAVVRALKADHNAVIDTRKMGVRASAVDDIRAWARAERVR